MISNVTIDLNANSIISFYSNKKSVSITLDDIRSFLKITESIEFCKTKIIGNRIVIIISFASGQGGAVFVWEEKISDFVHISNGSYVIDSYIYNNYLYNLRFISYWGKPASIEIWKIPFATMDVSEEGLNIVPK